MRVPMYRAGRKGLGGILLHPFRSDWVKLNPTGIEIVARAVKGERPKAISEGISLEFGISEERAAEDVFSVTKTLQSRGYLHSENNLDRPHRQPSLTSLFLHITDRCNLNCVHCYVNPAVGGPRRDLPADLVSQLVDEFVMAGGDAITVSGGEPLLHPEIERILADAASKVSIWLLTNGTLIDRDWAKRLSDLHLRVQISVDGSCPEVHDGIRGVGSFDRAMRSVKLLQEAGLSERLNFSTTVMQQNVDNVTEIISLAEALSVPFVRFAPVRKWGTAETTWVNTGLGLTPADHERFYEAAILRQKESPTHIDISCGLSGFMLDLPKSVTDDIWCTVGRQLVIDASGFTYPCVLLMQESFRLGNVFRESLTHMIESEKMSELCGMLVQRRSGIDVCSQCNWRNLCQAGCMGLALEHKGTIWDTDDFCDYRKRAYKEAFDRILRTEDF